MNPPIPPTGTAAQTRLLLVDDEPELLSTLAEILQDLGYAVVSTWEGEEAVCIATVFEPTVIITDFRLPGIDGVTTIQQVRAARPSVRAILMSGDLSPANLQRAVAQQVDRVFEKPISVRELLQELRWVAAQANRSCEDVAPPRARSGAPPSVGKGEVSRHETR